MISSLLINVANAATGTVVISEGTMASIIGYIPDLFSDLLPIFILVVGLPLAFWVVGKVIATAKAGFRTRTPRG